MVSVDMVGKYGGLLWFILGFKWTELCICRVSDSLHQVVDTSMGYCMLSLCEVVMSEAVVMVTNA